MGVAGSRTVRNALAAAGGAGLLLAGTSAQALAAPAVTLDPATVTTSGQLITVQVKGCAPGQPIAVSSTADTRPAVTVNADGNGSATTSVSSGGLAGTFTVSAACGGATATAPFTVVARTPSADDAGPAIDLKMVGAGGAVVAAVLVTAAVVLALVRRRAIVT